MGAHPINLGVRFLLELIAIIASGIWGWKQTDGWMQWVLAIIIPLAIATIWGTFAVPDDPSRSGAAPVVTPGIVRLMIELAIFSFGVWVLIDLGYFKWGLLLGSVVVLHYLVSYDRVIWLLSQ